MNFSDVFSQMLVILFVIAVGYGASRLGYLGGEVDRKLTKVLLNLSMPAMILASVLTGDHLPDTGVILSILWVDVIFYALSFAFAAILPRLLGGPVSQRGVWRFSLAFSNVAFIGYPVATALFGQEALFYTSLLALPFNLLSYTIGPVMLGGEARFSWRQLCSPCAVAAVIALVLALTKLPVPGVVTNALDFLGGMTIPLALALVGSLLADLPVRKMLGTPRIWGVAILRLLVLPVALFFILGALGTDPMVRNIATVQMAMPVAISGTLLSIQYGGDTDCMAQTTFLTTAAAMVTIPLLAVLLL